jgi:hypothetical protein
MMEEVPEKKCVLCGAALEGVEEEATGQFSCRHCGTTGRYESVNLIAIYIPNYQARLAELNSLNKELVRDIEIEGMRGGQKDMRYLQQKHLKRQDVLCEYAFLSHFKEFVEKW